mmetsp:Transcript_18675/g.38306  ORF Transcript_18675/g.38306 Transcript_18675/m.38306 type:complete len:94 (-) Transcript_18675:72-353(-)
MDADGNTISSHREGDTMTQSILFTRRTSTMIGTMKRSTNNSDSHEQQTTLFMIPPPFLRIAEPLLNYLKCKFGIVSDKQENFIHASLSINIYL